MCADVVKLDQKTAWRLLEATYYSWHDPQFQKKYGKKDTEKREKVIDQNPFSNNVYILFFICRVGWVIIPAMFLCSITSLGLIKD